MDYVALGRTGLKLNPLCLGTTNFGSHTTEEDAYTITDHALELGIISSTSPTWPGAITAALVKCASWLCTRLSMASRSKHGLNGEILTSIF